MSNIKRNFLYSSFLTTANYIFPIITYPYISRILGVSNIGLVNFIDSIINYFVLFSMMGISVIGIREIASVKLKKNYLNESFSSLLFISLILTIIALLLLSIATYILPELKSNSHLVFIGSIKLVFNLFLIEWFYKGLEEFKYITVRGLIVRCLYVLSVFIFIKDENDYQVYYLLSCLSIVLNASINIIYSRRFVTFSLRELKLRKFLKPIFTLGIYSILTSMYTTLNIVFLGFVSNDTEVGYYTTATKLYTIILSIFTAFTGVMLPRLSSLIHEGKIEEFKEKIRKSISLLLSVSIPIIIGVEILAKQIVYIVSGPGYEGAITPMRIVIPLILIIGYEQILVIQTLMPLRKDKTILRNSIFGALLGIILNICLVPKLQSVGSAIVWVCCELFILLLSQSAVRKYILIKDLSSQICNELIIYSLMGVIIHLVTMTINDYWVSSLMAMIILAVVFLINNIYIFRKNNEIRRVLLNLVNRFN